MSADVVSSGEIPSSSLAKLYVNKFETSEFFGFSKFTTPFSSLLSIYTTLSETISKNVEYTELTLDVGNAIIMYDLFNEKKNSE